MFRTSLVLASLVILPAAANAGGYVSAGIGSAPSLGGDVAASFDGTGHSSGRVALGRGFGPISIEAGLAGFGVTAMGSSNEARAYSGQVSAAAHAPLFLGLDLVARGGLERTWVSDDQMSEISGDGYLLGAGLDLTVAGTGVWVELDRQYLPHGTADTAMLGVRVGI